MPGRPSVNYDEALAYYAALGPARTFGKVAERFGVSDTAVRRRATRDRWQERVRAIDAEAALRAKEKVTRTRAERIEDTVKLVEAARVAYARQLSQGAKVTGHELAALLRIEALLEGEATDRVDYATFRDALTLALGRVATEERDSVLAELRALEAGNGRR